MKWVSRIPLAGAGNSAICGLLAVGSNQGERIVGARASQAALEVAELAQQRDVLVCELLVGLAGRLEHREGEGAAAGRGRDDTCGEAEEGVLVRAREHVDHARRGVGV